MTRQPHSRQPPNRAAVMGFVRFVVCGGGVGLASSGALVLLHDRMPLAVANALITVVSTLIATELHGRVTFRSNRGGWGVHLQSALTVAVSYAFTTSALVGLYALEPVPGAVLEQTVYLSASALAGIGRFVVLRTLVFTDSPTRGKHAISPATVAMAA